MSFVGSESFVRFRLLPSVFVRFRPISLPRKPQSQIPSANRRRALGIALACKSLACISSEARASTQASTQASKEASKQAQRQASKQASKRLSLGANPAASKTHGFVSNTCFVSFRLLSHPSDLDPSVNTYIIQQSNPNELLPRSPCAGSIGFNIHRALDIPDTRVCQYHYVYVMDCYIDTGYSSLYPIP